jgi:excisionase family DNA binding protein
VVEKIYTTEQVAQLLQIHPLTVLKYISSGKLRAIKLGRVYRIRESEIQKFLDRGSI